MSLKDELDTFYGLFKKHLNGANKATLQWVTCKSVNWGEGTMIAVDDEGLAFNDIMLGHGSMMVKPAIESDCLIGIVHGHEEMTFLISAESIDEVIYNGGDNGGLINIATLQENISSIKQFVEAINSALPTALNAIGSGAAASGSAGASAYSQSMAGKEIQIKNMEDPKIKH